MSVQISLYSNKKNEIEKFLSKFYNKKIHLKNKLEWNCEYQNPIESVDMLGTFIDNNEYFKINMWISLDEGFFLNVTNNNADKIIRYLFERYPY